MRSLSALSALAFLAACSGSDDTPTPSPSSTPVNTAPTFTSANSASLQENTTLAYQVTATDAENNPISFSISGGADAALFTLSAGGALSFVAPPNFEASRDAGADNIYNVQLRASDGAAAATLDIQITVTNSREGIAVRRIATGMDQPVMLLSDPIIPPSHGPVVFVVERTGRIWHVGVDAQEKSLAGTIGNLSTDGERGVLGMALHPQYNSWQLFFICATAPDGSIEVREYGARSPYRTLLSIPHPGNTNYGGWMGTYAGNLYVATGDGGSAGDPANNAQDPYSRLGKILRIRIDSRVGDVGSYPPSPGNPFLADGGDPYVFALGLRNPYRASFTADGQLIIGDAGESAFNEIDFARYDQPGLNFGWPYFQGTQPYRGTAPAGLVGPVSEYPYGNGPKEGRSVIGGYVYTGPVTSLRGLYVFGDAATGNIWTIPYAQLSQGTLFPAANYELRNADFKPDVGTIDRLVSFSVDTSGNLYLLDGDGEVFQVVAGGG